MDRAWQMGVQKIIITVGTIFDCEPAFKLIANDGEKKVVKVVDRLSAAHHKQI